MPRFPNRDEVTEHCRTAGQTRKFTLSSSAKERLEARGLSLADVCHVLSHGKVVADSGGTWELEGRALDGGALSLSVTFDGGSGVVVL